MYVETNEGSSAVDKLIVSNKLQKNVRKILIVDLAISAPYLLTVTFKESQLKERNNAIAITS